MDRCPVALDPAGNDVHAEGSRIREQGPVARIELPGGVLAWSVTDYAAAREVLSDHRFSKDGRRHFDAYVNGEVGEDFPMIGWVLMENMTTAYGADHTRLRKPCAHSFTPRRVEALRPAVAAIANELLDELAAVPAGRPVDLKALFAHPLPARAICDLFGVPAEARADMLRGGEVNVDTSISPEEAAANVARWHQEMLDFVESKRRTPGDDLTSDLVAAQREDSSLLSDDELVGTLHIMLATGTEPVKNLIANAVLALLTHPDQLELVRSGQATWQDVIEETLRVEAPVAHLPFRFAVEDVEIAGVTIAKGEPVLVNYAAVGRDPQLHGDDADRFDITRENKENLSFGHAIYRCIGQPLALLEAEIALSSLFERFPNLGLAVPAEEIGPQGTFIMNGVAELPVLLDARPATMKAAVVAEAGAVWELRDVPVPQPGPGQVLIRVRASGLCHNDLWLTDGHFPFPQADTVVVGHEGAGDVAAVGPGVTNRKPGDRVGATWVQGTCGSCDYCALGLPLTGQSGMNCTAPVMSGLTVPGHHAEYVVVLADSTVPLPDSVGYEQAAPMLCAGYTSLSALRAADPKPGERVAVLGIGGLGHLALQFSRAGGFDTVAITRSPDKHDLARELGASTVVADGEELRAAGGADVILVTGTSYEAATDALKGLRPNGRLVLATIDPEGSFTIAPHSPVWAQRQQIIGATHNGLEHLTEALDLLADGKVAPIIEVFPKERIAEAVALAAKGEIRFRAVITY
ncbi:cytochrome P450 [Streptomyces antarcticus]|uniref:cytochrome P450 n=1 Tax=Streptomyces antarcticus TaxID=2996458 RepID=UPI00226FFB76|nr:MULTISPECIES: cytochrome P450 [unclassified Streptomyces]MCY0942939.1 cytochrome P450 [Streptomyces sp. H34-AA3]MCY0953014.1 cytochrome P450 [Streptomyces sp. H27-S2]MCZ4083101.1 cytochrome P450 [Streptomyces sp. H34-S5]